MENLLNSSIFTEMPQNLKEKLVSGDQHLRKAISASLSLMKKHDRFWVEVVQQAAYDHFRTNGVSKEEATRIADFTTILINGSSAPVDAAPMMNHIGKFLLMYKTMNINFWNIIKDIKKGTSPFMFYNFSNLKKTDDLFDQIGKVTPKMSRTKRALELFFATALISTVSENFLDVRSPTVSVVNALRKGYEDYDNALF
jgi:hypothetical protein